MGDHARTHAVSYLSAIISSLSAIENCTKRRDSLEGQRLASLLISYNVTAGFRGSLAYVFAARRTLGLLRNSRQHPMQTGGALGNRTAIL